MGKILDPNLKPEKQHATPKQGDMKRLHIGQGRAGLRRKRSDPINQSINQPSNSSQKIPGRTEIETGKKTHMHTKNLTHSINNAGGRMTNNNLLIPRCSLPSRFSLQIPDQTHQARCIISSEFTKLSISISKILIQILILQKTPFQEGIMSKTFQRLEKSVFQEPKN